MDKGRRSYARAFRCRERRGEHAVDDEHVGTVPGNVVQDRPPHVRAKQERHKCIGLLLNGLARSPVQDAKWHEPRPEAARRLGLRHLPKDGDLVAACDETPSQRVGGHGVASAAKRHEMESADQRRAPSFWAESLSGYAGANKRPRTRSSNADAGTASGPTTPARNHSTSSGSARIRCRARRRRSRASSVNSPRSVVSIAVENRSLRMRSARSSTYGFSAVGDQSLLVSSSPLMMRASRAATDRPWPKCGSL